jgi:hypothetical protein
VRRLSFLAPIGDAMAFRACTTTRVLATEGRSMFYVARDAEKRAPVPLKRT